MDASESGNSSKKLNTSFKAKARFFLGAAAAVAILFFAAKFACFFGELWLKQEWNDTVVNLRRIHPRLEAYEKEHGKYPDQQDMRSLLKTLDMSDKDFIKVYTNDIGSAIYYTPSTDPEDPIEPVITFRVKTGVFSRYNLFFLKRDGTVGSWPLENGAGLKNTPEDKIIALEHSD